MLVGRDGERDHVERSLGRAAAGRSTALVVRGEAGMGKSALLDHAVASAGGMRVVRGVGIESEAELAFGALHLLLYPYLDRLDLLPGPQAAALRGAFGLSSDATTPFLVGAATLTLLAELASEKCARIAWDSDGCATYRAAAALFALPWSTTARK